MTEPELIEVLHRRFGLNGAQLKENISRPGFPKRLFGELIGAHKAHSLLLDLFNGSIIGNKTMCDTEKAIIREVKSWVNKPPALQHVCACFFESELEPSYTLKSACQGIRAELPT